MPKNSNEVDRYIAKAAPFARPVLEHLRELIVRVCPECEEKMKWSFPHFDYRGQMMCSMAAFKEHVAFGFWKAPLLDDPRRILAEEGAMGNLGKIRSMADLPSDRVLEGFIRQAMKLNEEGKTVVRKKTKPVAFEVPDDLTKALKKNPSAKKTFEAFSPSNKRDYVNWLLEARTDATREKRLETAIEWMSEGKIRNWKYVKK